MPPQFRVLPEIDDILGAEPARQVERGVVAVLGDDRQAVDVTPDHRGIAGIAEPVPRIDEPQGRRMGIVARGGEPGDERRRRWNVGARGIPDGADVARLHGSILGDELAPRLAAQG
jgi:hypothetical protein